MSWEKQINIDESSSIMKNGAMELLSWPTTIDLPIAPTSRFVLPGNCRQSFDRLIMAALPGFGFL